MLKGKRKFILVTSCAILVTAALFFGKIDGPSYSQVITMILGIFVAGNVAGKMTNKNGD